MTGWGQTGPLAAPAGHDINYSAVAGPLRHTARPGERPVMALNLVADHGGGSMYLVMGVLAALLEVARTGRGVVVDAAMVDGAANLMSLVHGMRAQGLWPNPPGENTLDGGAPFYDTYTCADGRFVAVGALEPAFYAELLAGLGLDPADLPEQWDPRGWPVLREHLARAIAGRTRDEWAAVFAGTNACLTPVLDMTEAPDHPQLAARGTFVDDPVTGAGCPVRRHGSDPATSPSSGPGNPAGGRDHGPYRLPGIGVRMEMAERIPRWSRGSARPRRVCDVHVHADRRRVRRVTRLEGSTGLGGPGGGITAPRRPGGLLRARHGGLGWCGCHDVRVATPLVTLPHPGPDLVAEAAVVVAEAGVPVETVSTSGSPASVLVEQSRTAVMVVIGSRGHGSISSAILGSTVSHVASHAHCPVIVAQAQGAPDGPVVVGVDGSADSEELVGWAIDHASRHGLALEVLHSYAIPVYPGVVPYVPPVEITTATAGFEARVTSEVLAGWREKYPDVEIITNVAHGRPGPALVEATGRASLTVVGSHGRGAFLGMLLGSTSQSLLHHATGSVAVLRHRKP